MKLVSYFLVFVFLFVYSDAARCDETIDYVRHIHEAAPLLLNFAFELDGGTNKDGQNFAGTCNNGCKNFIKDIEAQKFSLIAPIVYTSSAGIFYKVLVANTPCRNLGILSYVDSIEGTEHATEDPSFDFFRPTGGFALYRISEVNQNFFLLRAEDYVDSGDSADSKSESDENIEPNDLLGLDKKNIERSGEFLEVSSKDCSRIGGPIFFNKSSSGDTGSTSDVNFNTSWLSNPIRYRNRIYLLNPTIYFPNSRQLKTEYVVTITNLSLGIFPRLDFFYYK